MGIEDKIYNIREEQNKINESDLSKYEKEKYLDKLNKRAEKLVNANTKIGEKRMGVIMDHAILENKYRDSFNDFADHNNLQIDWELFKKQIENDRRYVAMVVESFENGKLVPRFLKSLKPNPDIERFDEDRNAFVREITTTKYLASNQNIPSLKVAQSDVDPEQDNNHALLETLPEAEIGFIHSQEDIKKLTAEHAKQCVDQIINLTEAPLPPDIDERIPDLQDVFEHYKGYQENVMNILDNQEWPEDSLVRPLDGIKNYEGEIIPEVFIEVLARRVFGIKDWQNFSDYQKDAITRKFRKKVIELFGKFQDVMDRYDNQNWVLSHGDLSPQNLYVHDSGNVQFHDWEWSGKTKNKLLSMIYDYGNLRARAWNNEEFRQALDNEIIDKFRKASDEEAGIAVVALGTFRSHSMLAGFFENYEPDTQELPEETLRREATEADIRKVFELSGIATPSVSEVSQELPDRIEKTSHFQELIDSDALKLADEWLKEVEEAKKSGSEKFSNYDDRWIDHRQRELFRAYNQAQEWSNSKKIIERTKDQNSKHGRIKRLEELSQIPYADIN